MGRSHVECKILGLSNLGASLCSFHGGLSPLGLVVYCFRHLQLRPRLSQSYSNASVPSAAALTIIVPAVCDDDSRKILGIFPAEVAREAKADRGAVVGGQGLTIHAIGKQRLRMKGVSHVYAIPQYAYNPPTLIGVREWLEHDVS